jgi:hypothetical protein
LLWLSAKISNIAEKLFTAEPFVGIEHQHMLQKFTALWAETRGNGDSLFLNEFKRFHDILSLVEIGPR